MTSGQFQFKEFAMIQGQSGQRINTDSCFFADLVDANSPTQILDVGCGSGVLSLMMAQKFPTAIITGVEVDADDAALAAKNFLASPWRERLILRNQKVQDLHDENSHQFDLIVCNPPFFSASTKSRDPARALARHDDQLSAQDLTASINRFIAPGGVAWLLCAADEATRWLEAFRIEDLNLGFKVALADNPKAAPHAFALSFSRENVIPNLVRRVDYRVAPGGERSGCMQQHRERWFPY